MLQELVSNPPMRHKRKSVMPQLLILLIALSCSVYVGTTTIFLNALPIQA